MNATKRLKYEQACILNEVIEAGNKEEVVDKHLQHIPSMNQWHNTPHCCNGRIHIDKQLTDSILPDTFSQQCKHAIKLLTI